MHKRFSIVVGIGIDTSSLDLEHILLVDSKGGLLSRRKNHVGVLVASWCKICRWGMAYPLDFLATVGSILQTLQLPVDLFMFSLAKFIPS